MFEPLSPFYDPRKPSMLIIHGSGEDAAGTKHILLGKGERPVSCHYMVDHDGNITQFLDETVCARHAGISYWSGFEDLNTISVGIEVECRGNDESFEWPESHYTEVQLQAVAELSRNIIQSNNILPHNVVSHQDVASYRKVDPGPRFDWSILAKQGVGLWHDLQRNDFDKIVFDKIEIEKFKKNLTLYGYDPRPNKEGKDYSRIITAFQTHFLPWNICGQVTEQSVKALDILLEKKFS